MQTDSVLSEKFLLAFDEAVHKATNGEKNILFSSTQSIEWCHPLHLFDSKPKELEPCFFWEKPSEHKGLVGIGAAFIIEAQGSERFNTVAHRWQELVNDAVIHSTLEGPEQTAYYPYGPLLIGGFAFDPQRFHSSLWEHLPNSMMFLPYLLISTGADYATLTISQIIHPNTDARQSLATIAAHIQQLLTPSFQRSYRASDQNTATLIEQSDPHLLTADLWQDMVTDTVLMLREGEYQKVVLSRGVKVTPVARTQTFDVPATLSLLQQNYPDTYLFAFQYKDLSFCGATPEQLASVRNGNVHTMALAGTAQRGSIDGNGTELLLNGKDKKEHEFVVAMIRNVLETLCSEITSASSPHVFKLKNVQHLRTRIQGQLLSGYTILDVIARLHPTPAVGGLPRKEALEVIRAKEHLERGWYAGPIGWLDARGDGEFAVAIRSALIAKQSAVLFAGCGIVDASQPEKEYEESCWKLQAMRQNLCVEDHEE